jgi:hypothetical protein
MRPQWGEHPIVISLKKAMIQAVNKKARFSGLFLLGAGVVSGSFLQPIGQIFETNEILVRAPRLSVAGRLRHHHCAAGSGRFDLVGAGAMTRIYFIHEPQEPDPQIRRW